MLYILCMYNKCVYTYIYIYIYTLLLLLSLYIYIYICVPCDFGTRSLAVQCIERAAVRKSRFRDFASEVWWTFCSSTQVAMGS